MYLSTQGLAFIAHWENFVSKPYKDVAGLWTVGYGHRCSWLDLIKYRKGITEEQGRALLLNDIQGPVNLLNKQLPNLNQNQFDALVSFIYNVGQGAFLGSTMFKLLKVNNYTAAANEFTRWCHAGGKIIVGLLLRRKAEKTIFIRPI